MGDESTEKKAVVLQPHQTGILRSLPDFPARIKGSVAVLNNGIIHVCGGKYTRKCFIFDPVVQGWTQLAQLPTERSGSAALSVRRGIWITGGGPEADADLLVSNTTLIIQSNGRYGHLHLS